MEALGGLAVAERDIRAERPPAARGLSSHENECGDVRGECFSHGTLP